MNDAHQPNEKALTEAARRKVEEDNREAPDNRPMGPVGNLPSSEESAQRAAEGGLTEAALPGHGPTADDASPETLMPDDGRRSAAESVGDTQAADTELTEVRSAEIGGGRGLDEAELGRARPLDGKPWDGDRSERLQPATSTDDSLTAPPGTEPDDPGTAS